MDAFEIAVCVIAGLVALYIITIMICRALYPFWFSMSVWHSFDLHRHALVWRPALIDESPHLRPPHSHYYAAKDRVNTRPWGDLDAKERAAVLDLIQRYYGTTSETFQAMTAAELDAILAGPSIVSLLLKTEAEKTKIYDSELGWIEDESQKSSSAAAIGCIASHAYRMILGGKHYRIYYVDLMAAPSAEGKKATEQLVYSHIYNQQRENTHIAMTLFKKTGEPIRGCRDFLWYRTYCYDASRVPWSPPPQMGIRITIVDNLEGIRQVLENPRLSRFALTIAGDAEYAWRQVQNGRWVIGVLWDNKNNEGAKNEMGTPFDEPMAYYFFSRESVEWSAFGDRKALRAMCAVTFRADMSDELFFAAFGEIARKAAQHNSSATATATATALLEIDEVGDLDRVLRHLARVPPQHVQDNYLYFYNFLCPWRIAPRNALLIM
jgi:hypothetical protein